MTVTMEAVLTPSCPTIIKIRIAYIHVFAADIRNLDTPTSIDVLFRNFSSTFRRTPISFLPIRNITIDTTVLKSRFDKNGVIDCKNCCSAPGVRSEGSIVGVSGVSVHARIKISESI